MESWVAKIVEIIVRNYDPDEICLFGSMSKNQSNMESDIDLLIIKDTDIPRRFRGSSFKEQLSRFPIKIDLLFYTHAELESAKKKKYSFIDAISRKTKIVYKKF
ncbi:MAG: nucleotidyltransferase domain-containing protein [Bacteroidetes bacterium]|nr:nucleotidyltransferase domain-containing protein [Bacteroidota bacterium]